ncbi:MAG: hypothetical protein KME35_24325 [Aphanocapsa sp. GSE-SYN-MK-11-07L]|nr:hypothetical protein [Aphanocapsa sp. GSE-SYN-MK-11-07L]
MTQVVTIAALNIASEMMAEHDPSKTKGEWCAWLMEEAAQRLGQAENQEEVNKIMMGN